MAFDRKDFTDEVARKRDAGNREMLPMYRALAAAAPVMGKLMTGNESWDRFLSILGGQVERITRLRDAARLKLCDRALWDDAAMRELKANALEASAMLDMLQFVMELPKALLEDGEKAQGIVSRFEAKDDKAASST